MNASAEAPAVLAEGVGRTFTDRNNHVRALTGVDLRIAPGELVSIIGPSGCGKSTLLRLIGGLIEPSEGRLTVAGRSPRQGRREKRFGLVPQTPALLPWRTVRENLTLLPRLNRRNSRGLVSDQEIDELLDSVGLSPFADALPSSLSGGMQQRVSLVRAFALQPPVLLMDEPFASLDEITRSEMRFLLLEMWGRTQATIVFVTHSIDEAVLLSDRVVVMSASPGRVQEQLDISIPRPRRHGVEDKDLFHHHTAQLRRLLDEAVANGKPGGRRGQAHSPGLHTGGPASNNPTTPGPGL